MKKKIIFYQLILGFGLLNAPVSFAQTKSDRSFGAIELKNSVIPIRPGKPGVRPFWNIYAKRFIYAPAFDYKTIPNAKKYRYDILCLSDSSTYSFESDVPYAALSPVWTKMPVCTFRITVVGISDRGDSLGLAGEGQYYRASPFDPPGSGAYHRPVMRYDSSAVIALDSLMHKSYVGYWLEHKKPDPDYPFYEYPAKIMGALVAGAVAYARLKPHTGDAGRSVKLARIVADYMIGISFPKGSALPYFPPTYHGYHIGQNPDAHRQLYKSLIIAAAGAGNAYLDLYDLTGVKKYLQAAKEIAGTYIETQLKNGSWYLYINYKTGEPTVQNIAIPIAIIAYLDRIKQYDDMAGLDKAKKNALNWIMANPVTTFNWQGEYEDVDIRRYAPYEKMSREQACDLAIYLFKNHRGHPGYTGLAEELIRFAEDQFIIWEQPRDFWVGKKNQSRPGYHSMNWITPCVQEQYRLWLPITRGAGIMIETYWQAYSATKKEIYLAKAKSIANSLTLVQEQHHGNYPTRFTRYPMNFWLNSVVYPAKVMASFQRHLDELK